MLTCSWKDFSGACGGLSSLVDFQEVLFRFQVLKMIDKFYINVPQMMCVRLLRRFGLVQI